MIGVIREGLARSSRCSVSVGDRRNALASASSTSSEALADCPLFQSHVVGDRHPSKLSHFFAPQSRHPSAFPGVVNANLCRIDGVTTRPQELSEASRHGR